MTNKSSSKEGFKNFQDFNQKSENSYGGRKNMSRSSMKNRYNTARNPSASNHHKASNPYISHIFKENELLTASNAYHRLDKSQNFLANKAFACTIINDLKQRQRQDEFEKRVGVLNSDSAMESSKLQKEASRDYFKRQQNEIYNSSVFLNRAAAKGSTQGNNEI